MRVVLVGPADGRARLRHALPAGMEIVGEAATLGAARASSSAADADAWLVVADEDDADGVDGPMVEALTPRERDVLELIAQGLPNKAIAARLAISDQTVKVHLGSIYGKLQASNRTDAVRRAIRRGLVSV